MQRNCLLCLRSVFSNTALLMCHSLLSCPLKYNWEVTGNNVIPSDFQIRTHWWEHHGQLERVRENSWTVPCTKKERLSFLSLLETSLLVSLPGCWCSLYDPTLSSMLLMVSAPPVHNHCFKSYHWNSAPKISSDAWLHSFILFLCCRAYTAPSINKAHKINAGITGLSCSLLFWELQLSPCLPPTHFLCFCLEDYTGITMEAEQVLCTFLTLNFHISGWLTE